MGQSGLQRSVLTARYRSVKQVITQTYDTVVPRGRWKPRRIVLPAMHFVGRTLASVCLFLSLVSCVLLSQERPKAPLVDVELAVLGPDGQPLRKTPIQIKAVRPGFVNPLPPRVDPTTDEDGIAHFQWPAGVYEISVLAPEIG